MNILIAGGGTGGHLFPAIAVAEELCSVRPDAKITFVGTAKGLEAKVIPLTMWELVMMNVPQIKGKGFFHKLKAFILLPLTIFRSIRVVLKVKPELVISVGGFSAGPVTLAAWLMGKRTFLMEQNAIAGFTNRILGHFVKKAFLTFDVSAKYFPAKKVFVSGNPVRRKIRAAATHKPVKRPRFTVLVFGGSQGAKAINESMLASLDHLKEERDDLHVIHQIGQVEDIERYSAVYRAKGFSCEVYHFIEDMAKTYSSVDLVVCRAGATSIAELSVMGKPAIFIPFPHAADNHQEANARALVEIGAASIILNKEMNGEILANEIKGLMEDQLKLDSMAESMRRWARPEAAREIVEECLRLISS